MPCNCALKQHRRGASAYSSNDATQARYCVVEQQLCDLTHAKVQGRTTFGDFQGNNLMSQKRVLQMFTLK